MYMFLPLDIEKNRLLCQQNMRDNQSVIQY
uniref:Uncharacterized protein n=1 Tax=Myoviridae sp. ctxpQ22 TaxID=2826715 RepID=A0A8S5N4D3_9CAUD|nr:MAG TPA: hypothetical protein [Myoviridae sp. ctxpQ22]